MTTAPTGLVDKLRAAKFDSEKAVLQNAVSTLYKTAKLKKYLPQETP